MNDIHFKDRTAAKSKGKPMVKGPQKPWEIDIDVYLYSVGPPADFEIKTFLPRDAKGNPNFYDQGRDGFVISFRLYDNTNGGAGSGYVFPNPPAPPNKKDQWALWSQKGPGCPPKDCGQWSEFTSQSVKDQGQTLVVVNENKTVTEFGYTLRVTNGDGKYHDLDPGGYNQNGNAL